MNWLDFKKKRVKRRHKKKNYNKKIVKSKDRFHSCGISSHFNSSTFIFFLCLTFWPSIRMKLTRSKPKSDSVRTATNTRNKKKWKINEMRTFLNRFMIEMILSFARWSRYVRPCPWLLCLFFSSPFVLPTLFCLFFCRFFCCVLRAFKLKFLYGQMRVGRIKLQERSTLIHSIHCADTHKQLYLICI